MMLKLSVLDREGGKERIEALNNRILIDLVCVKCEALTPICTNN